MPAPGETTLYRPVPRDFEETFVRIGWGEIESHYRAHAKTIAKWLEVCGRDRLRAARAAYVREHGVARNPVRMNYVMGRTNRRNAGAIALDLPAE
jgi:hypothetical protein